MMNAGIFLVPTVHEIAIAAEVAIAARTAEKSDTHALPNRPALDTGTKRIDPPNELVARDARPINGELALYRAGIRVAHPTRLDPNPDLTRRERRQFPLHHFQAAGLTRLHCTIACCCHRRPFVLRKRFCPQSSQRSCRTQNIRMDVSSIRTVHAPHWRGRNPSWFLSDRHTRGERRAASRAAQDAGCAANR